MHSVFFVCLFFFFFTVSAVPLWQGAAGAWRSRRIAAGNPEENSQRPAYLHPHQLWRYTKGGAQADTSLSSFQPLSSLLVCGQELRETAADDCVIELTVSPQQFVSVSAASCWSPIDATIVQCVISTAFCLCTDTEQTQHIQLTV